MIKSFVHKGLEKFYYDGSTAKIQANHENKLALILDKLNAATGPRDMDLPGFRLHSHNGHKKAELPTWSVDVSGNWRVTFVFEGGDVYIVDYCDPH